MTKNLILDTNLLSFICRTENSNSRSWVRRTHSGALSNLFEEYNLIIPMVAYAEIFRHETKDREWMENFLSQFEASLVVPESYTGKLGREHNMPQSEFKERSLQYITKETEAYFDKISYYKIDKDKKTNKIKHSGIDNKMIRHIDNLASQYAHSKTNEIKSLDYYFIKYMYLSLISLKKDEKNLLENKDCFRNVFCDFLYLNEAVATKSTFITDDKLLYVRSRALHKNFNSMRFNKELYNKIEDPRELMKRATVKFFADNQNPISIDNKLHQNFFEYYGAKVSGQYGEKDCLFWM